MSLIQQDEVVLEVFKEPTKSKYKKTWDKFRLHLENSSDLEYKMPTEMEFLNYF